MNRASAPVIGRLLSRKKAGRAKRSRRASSRPRVGGPSASRRTPTGSSRPGDVQVVSEFAQAPSRRLRRRHPTQRISTTRRLGRTVSQPLADPAAAGATYARISYKDDSGAKEFLVTKEEIVIGREAPDVWVDLRLDTSLDVSREHARLQRAGRRWLPHQGPLEARHHGRRQAPPVEPGRRGRGGARPRPLGRAARPRPHRPRRDRLPRLRAHRGRSVTGVTSLFFARLALLAALAAAVALLARPRSARHGARSSAVRGAPGREPRPSPSRRRRVSDPGRERGNNEDRVLCDPERGIFAVIDGVGGESAGEIAAAHGARDPPRPPLPPHHRRRPPDARGDRPRQQADPRAGAKADPAARRHGRAC